MGNDCAYVCRELQLGNGSFSKTEKDIFNTTVNVNYLV